MDTVRTAEEARELTTYGALTERPGCSKSEGILPGVTGTCGDSAGDRLSRPKQEVSGTKIGLRLLLGLFAVSHYDLKQRLTWSDL